MWIIKSGVIFSILSIVIGAFGAHALENTIEDKIEVFKTGVQYQIFHALGLILIGLIAKTFSISSATSSLVVLRSLVCHN